MSRIVRKEELQSLLTQVCATLRIPVQGPKGHGLHIVESLRHEFAIRHSDASNPLGTDPLGSHFVDGESLIEALTLTLAFAEQGGVVKEAKAARNAREVLWPAKSSTEEWDSDTLAEVADELRAE